MFFRQKRSGKHVYLQIVENRWEDGRSKQRVIATLGRLDELREQGRLDELLRSGAKFSQSALLLSAQQKGEHSQQLRLLREGVTNCTPSDSLLNNFAYALATAPADADRDGVEALRIAQEITSSDGGDRPDFLDTLASAHAEVGDFEAAVATQRRVIALLDSRGESIEDAHEHLARYEAGRPVREN